MNRISKPPVSFIVLSSLIAVAVWGGLRMEKWRTESESLVETLLASSSSVVVKTTKDISLEALPKPVRSFFQRTLPSLEQGRTIPSIRSVRFTQNGHFRLSEESEWMPLTARQTMSASASLGFIWEAEMPLIQKLGWPRVYIRDAWMGDQAQLKASVEGIVPIASEDSSNPALLQGEIMRWLAEAFLVPTALLPSSGNVEWSELRSDTDNKVQISMKYFDRDTDSSLKSDVVMQERSFQTVFLNTTFQERDTGDFEITVEGMRQRHKDGTFVAGPWLGRLSQWKTMQIKDTPEAFSFPTHMECGWKKSDEDSVFFYFVADNHDYQYDWKDEAAFASTT